MGQALMTDTSYAAPAPLPREAATPTT